MANISALTQKVAQTTSAVGKGAVKTIGNIAGDSVLSEFTPRQLMSTFKSMAFSELPGLRTVISETKSFMKNLKKNSDAYLKQAQKNSKDATDKIVDAVEDVIDHLEDAFDASDDNEEGFEIAQASLDSLESIDEKFSDLLIEITTLSDITAKVWGVSKEELEQIGLANQLQRMQIDDARKFQAENELDQQIAAAQALETSHKLDALSESSSSSSPSSETKQETRTFWDDLFSGIGMKIGGSLLSGVTAALGFAGASVLGTLMGSIVSGAGKLASGGLTALMAGGSAIASGVGAVAGFLTSGTAMAVVGKLGLVGLLAAGVVGGIGEAWDTYEKGGSLHDVIFSFMDGFVNGIWGTVSGIMNFMVDLIQEALKPSMAQIIEETQATIDKMKAEVAPPSTEMREMLSEVTDSLGGALGGWIEQGLTQITPEYIEELQRRIDEAKTTQDRDAAIAAFNDGMAKMQQYLMAGMMVAGQPIRTEDLISMGQGAGDVYADMTDTFINANGTLQEIRDRLAHTLENWQSLADKGQFGRIDPSNITVFEELLNHALNYANTAQDWTMTDALLQIQGQYQDLLFQTRDPTRDEIKPLELDPTIFSNEPVSSLPQFNPSDAERAFDMFSADQAKEDNSMDALIDYLTTFTPVPPTGTQPGSPLSNFLTQQAPTVNAPTFISPPAPRDDWQGPAGSPASPFRVSP
jgi:alkylated DNA nucleotide flippase Atl1